MEKRIVDAGIEVEDDVRLGEGGRSARGCVAGSGDGAPGDRFVCKIPGLLDELLETGECVDAGEVLVLLDGGGIAESEENGLLQLCESLTCLFAVGERAGEVVVPGGVAGHEFQRRSAGCLHGGDVTAADRLDQLLTEHIMARPDVGIGPDGKRLLLGKDKSDEGHG